MKQTPDKYGYITKNIEKKNIKLFNIKNKKNGFILNGLFLFGWHIVTFLKTSQGTFFSIFKKVIEIN